MSCHESLALHCAALWSTMKVAACTMERCTVRDLSMAPMMLWRAGQCFIAPPCFADAGEPPREGLEQGVTTVGDGRAVHDCGHDECDVHAQVAVLACWVGERRQLPCDRLGVVDVWGRGNG